MIEAAAAPFSHRSDPSVPSFPDEGRVVFMDGRCRLCSGGARMIAGRDRRREFRIGWTESGVGRAVLRHYGLDPENPESWLFLDRGRAYVSLDAIIRVGWTLGGAGRALALLRILPRPLQDWVYARIARNRYRIFGRAESCAVPDGDLRSRFIE
jgi:predicted DCC family thiol-disulfide oxidoreductase YuxK